MIQTPACDRCTQGVMDAANDHLRGICSCECHKVGRDQTDAGVREAERRYETRLESLKDHGP